MRLGDVSFEGAALGSDSPVRRMWLTRANSRARSRAEAGRWAGFFSSSCMTSARSSAGTDSGSGGTFWFTCAKAISTCEDPVKGRFPAMAVQVSGGSRRIARSLLRGQVLGCSHDHAHRGQLFLMRAKRNAEIGKLGDSIRTHQNIRRFDVAVNNPRAMDGVQSIGGLVHDRQQQIQLQSSAILQ